MALFEPAPGLRLRDPRTMAWIEGPVDAPEHDLAFTRLIRDGDLVPVPDAAPVAPPAEPAPQPAPAPAEPHHDEPAPAPQPAPEPHAEA